MISLLLLGFLLGMRHALETDHVAAVTSLATRSKDVRGTVLQGAAWGLGHTITLLAVGGACLLLRTAIPPRVASALEAAVGVMLLVLGADVLRRLRRDRVHVHVHRHDDGTVHLHAHSHAPDAPHPAHPAHPADNPLAPHPQPPPHPQSQHLQPSPTPTSAAHDHDNDHGHHHLHRSAGFPARALLVGLVHGMAGSAALLLVAVTTLSSVWLGVVYIAVFGAGSILGMAVLAAVISLPLQGTAHNLARWYGALEALVGVGTILVGAWVLWQASWVHEIVKGWH